LSIRNISVEVQYVVQVRSLMLKDISELSEDIQRLDAEVGGYNLTVFVGCYDS